MYALPISRVEDTEWNFTLVSQLSDGKDALRSLVQNNPGANAMYVRDPAITLQIWSAIAGSD